MNFIGITIQRVQLTVKDDLGALFFILQGVVPQARCQSFLLVCMTLGDVVVVRG